MLEVHPELGIAPGLFGSISTSRLIKALTREEDTAADLPGHVVSGGEEVGVDHVDFLPYVIRGAMLLGPISKTLACLTGMIPTVGCLLEFKQMPGHFEVAVRVGPQLEAECKMVHVLPGHAVHVPEVNVVRGVQLIEASPFLSSPGLFTGGRVELGAQAGRHGHRQGHATVDMESIGLDIHVPGTSFGTRAHAYFPELVVAFQRDVHAGASRSELLNGPAAEVCRIGSQDEAHLSHSTCSAVMPDVGGFQDHARDLHGRPDIDNVTIIVSCRVPIRHLRRTILPDGLSPYQGPY